MRHTDIRRLVTRMVSVTNMLRLQEIAIILPDEVYMQTAYSAVASAYMCETWVGGDGKTFILMKSFTNVYLFGPDTTLPTEYDLIYRIRELSYILH